MAGEYNLRLKAVLDTSEVKNKLNELRSLQQQSLGNDIKGGSNHNTNGVANINGLASVLNRLNTTLMQLERSINQSVQINRSLSMKNANIQSGNGLPALALGGVGGNKSSVGLITQKAVDNEVRAAVKNALKTRDQSNWTAQITGIGYKGIFPGGLSGSPAQRDTFERYFGGMTWSELNSKQYRDSINSFLYPVNKQNSLRHPQNRAMWGLIAHQGFSTLQKGLELGGYGDNNLFSNNSMFSMSTSDAMSGIGKTGSYALIGSTAGPLGATIGAIIGIVDSMFDAILKKAQESQAELDEWNANVEKATRFKKHRADFEDNQVYTKQIKSAIDEKSIEKLQSIRSGVQYEFEKAHADILNQEKLAKSGSISGNADEINANYEKQVHRLNQIDDLINDINKKKKQEVEIESKKTLAYTSQAKLMFEQYRMDKRSREITGDLARGGLNESDHADYYNVYLSKVQSYRDKYKYSLEKAMNASTPEEGKKFMEEAHRYNRYMQWSQTQMQAYGGNLIDQLQTRLSQLKAPSMDQVTSLASQGFAISTKDDAIRLKAEANYQEEQTRLQRQIRDKVLQMTTESQYQ